MGHASLGLRRRIHMVLKRDDHLKIMFDRSMLRPIGDCSPEARGQGPFFSSETLGFRCGGTLSLESLQYLGASTG